MTGRLAALTLVALAALAAMAILSSCAEVRKMDSQKLLLDAEHPPRQMFHVTIVDDPFGQFGKVLRGGPPGPNNKVAANKASLLNGQGFFTVPADGGELRLFVAVRKLTELKVEVLSKNPAGKKAYHVAVPAAGQWQELVLPLDTAALPAGSTVHDITVFQLGQQDPQAELYIAAVKLRTH